jgi:hypothetical protein
MGENNSNDSRLKIRNHGGQEEVAQHSLQKNLPNHNPTEIKQPPEMKRMKTFSDRGKLRESVASRHSLKE